MRKSFLISFFLLMTFHALAQTDCGNALVVCGNTNFENLELNGSGNLQEISSCGSEEHNSLWLRINIQASGTFAFNIVPQSTNLGEDFDFFLFEYVSCQDYAQIRCSTTHPLSAGLTTNVTGLNEFESDFFEGPSAQGSGFVKSVDALAGETYMLVIDRPAGNSNFTIEWTGTAAFNEPPEITLPPGLTSFDVFKCDTDGIADGFTTFDLTQNTPQILGSQTDVVVTYYTSQSDSLLGINEIANPATFTNTSNPQTVYFRVKNQLTECFSNSEFVIGINNEVTLFETKYETCDDMADGNASNGQAMFNMQSVANAVFSEASGPNVSIQFFLTAQDAVNDVNPLPSNYYNATPFQQTVFIKIDSDSCDATKPIDLIVNSIQAQPAGELVQCDFGANPDGISVFNLSQADAFYTASDPNLSVQYFETAVAMASGNALATVYTNLTNPQTVFVKITNTVSGCSINNTLSLKVNTVTAQTILPFEKCDISNTGFAQFNLNFANVVTTAVETAAFYPTLQDALLQQNQIGNVAAFTNPTAFNASVFVRIDDMANGCSGISEIKLVVNPLPFVQSVDQAVICANQPGAQVAINAGPLPPEAYTYQWTFGTTSLPGGHAITATQAGLYTVAITNSTGCTSTRTIQVIPSNMPVIESVTVVNNMATVNLAAESTDFGFSIDLPNGPFQSGNYFGALPCGPHIAYVDDGAGCNVATFAFEVMIIPTYFSPNGDGIADRWNIECGRNYPAATIDIFDRYGKLLLTIRAAGAGWDGTYNGKPMPSDDYWYVLRDGDKITKGHFAMKR